MNTLFIRFFNGLLLPSALFFYRCHPAALFSFVIPQLFFILCHPAAKRRDLQFNPSVHPMTEGANTKPFARKRDPASIRSMREQHRYWVYILSSRSRTLYVGVTNRLVHRVLQHREGVGSEFTARYRIHRLVHFEEFQWIQTAIAREKELKDWRRELKLALIEESNPAWADLAEGWSQRIDLPQYDWKRERD